MVKKRRKKRTKEEVISPPPEMEIEEMIEEYKDYVSIIEHEPVPLSEPIEPSPPSSKTRKIKYLGIPDVFIIKGPMTGQRYRFIAKDKVSTVAIEDYEGLLQRVRPARKCCGGKTIPEQPYFGPI
jgi:hypothetical protein